MSVETEIAGTVIFGPTEAMRGYALNCMCFSFNDQTNREAFVENPEAYMEIYGLDEAQKDAIRAKNVLHLIEVGGNAYYLAKFAGIFGLNMQDIGAQQTGLSVPEFKAHLASYASKCAMVMKGARP